MNRANPNRRRAFVMSGACGGLLFLIGLIGKLCFLLGRCVLYVLIGKRAFKSHNQEHPYWHVLIGSIFIGIIPAIFICEHYDDSDANLSKIGLFFVIVLFFSPFFGTLLYLLNRGLEEKSD